MALNYGADIRSYLVQPSGRPRVVPLRGFPGRFNQSAGLRPRGHLLRKALDRVAPRWIATRARGFRGGSCSAPAPRPPWNFISLTGCSTGSARLDGHGHGDVSVGSGLSANVGSPSAFPAWASASAPHPHAGDRLYPAAFFLEAGFLFIGFSLLIPGILIRSY